MSLRAKGVRGYGDKVSRDLYRAQQKEKRDFIASAYPRSLCKSLETLLPKSVKPWWMETLHHQIAYDLRTDLKPLPLSIPIISFTHIKDSTTVGKGDNLKEINNNDNNNDKGDSNSVNERFDSLTDQQTDGQKDKTNGDLPTRLKNLRQSITWIHTELKKLQDQDAYLIQQFNDIEGDMKDLQHVLASPFTSYGSLHSLNEDRNNLHLTDQFEYEFRARTSSLLLPHRKTYDSPGISRKSYANRSVSGLARPKSLTHLYIDFES